VNEGRDGTGGEGCQKPSHNAGEKVGGEKKRKAYEEGRASILTKKFLELPTDGI